MSIKRINAEESAVPAASSTERIPGTSDVTLSTPTSSNGAALDGDLAAVLDALLGMAESE